MKDEVLLRDLLAKEEDAVSSYIDAADKISNEDFKRVLLEIAREEAVHKGELMELLKWIGASDKEEIKKGEEEAKETLLKSPNPIAPNNTDASEIIKEVMSDFCRTGKIGDKTPMDKKDAMKQAAIIACDAKKNR